VVVESGAGTESGITDADYLAAGAEIGDPWSAPVVLKVRPPTVDEIGRLAPGALVISLLQPERDPTLVPALVARGASALALERVPRITRAQKMDVLSSMANLAGYRAVVEAAAAFEGNFGAQVTAAGTVPPTRVLVIGAGVAGLAAIAAAKALGAEVRAFDTRAAAREQVESLGAKFLEVSLAESGEGGGGYAKLMSPEFIAAEMALFREQAKECRIAITTALVPGAKAPILLPTDVVESFAPGSVIVDMAAEQGGNCALTQPDAVVEHRGVKILGITDLPSRMAPTASKFFATNLANLVAELGPAASWSLSMDNDVIRPALVVHNGEILPPPPRPEPSPQKAPPASTAKPAIAHPTAPPSSPWGFNLIGVLGVIALFAVGRFAPGEFLQHFTVFILSCFIGWQVVWAVTPALHTPLMSVTNAISGIIVVGGMLQIAANPGLGTILGAIAVLVASINIAGGFLVTERMLGMFHREGAPAPRGHR
jgi:NAD(P) transhydrogenase subunit alpha